MKFRKINILVFACTFMSLSVAESNGDLVVSGATITNDLAIMALDCTANTGGGALTTDADGVVICSDDNGTPGPHTVDTDTNAATICTGNQFLNGNGSCIPMVVDTDTNAATICAGGQFLNGDGSCDPVVVDTDTTLSEGEVDAFVDNNGYGDITGITTSSNSGLSGGVTSGTATLSVDPTDFMEPPGISASSNGTIDSHYNTAAETVASRSLSAPVAGVIVAIATANYVYCGSLSSTNTRCDLYHTLATSPVTSAISGSYQQCSFLYTGGAPAPQNYEYRTCTVMASFSVNAGTSTIYWQAGVGDEINDSVYINNGDLMTIFIPN